jgi:hypothetical protein
MIIKPPGSSIDFEDVKEFYIELSDVGGEKSYRDVKHYRVGKDGCNLL